MATWRIGYRVTVKSKPISCASFGTIPCCGSDGMLDLQSGADDSCAPLCRANNSSDIQHGAVSNDAENISSNSSLICVYVEL